MKPVLRFVAQAEPRALRRMAAIAVGAVEAMASADTSCTLSVRDGKCLFLKVSAGI
jgi:hypothetical protein